MNKYIIDGAHIDSADLKCLLISRGVKVDNAVYHKYKNSARLNSNPLCCNCLVLSDGTIAQLTDVNFHMSYLSGILSWDNLKLLKYAGELGTPFSLRMQDDNPVLFYGKEELDIVSFPPASSFYRQKTASSLPYAGNAVLQGVDWVAFQCLWPCEYAAGGQPCQYCFSGADFENAAKKGKALPAAVPAADVAEIVEYAVKKDGMRHVQIAGGSTYDGHAEHGHISGYLSAIAATKGLSPEKTGKTGDGSASLSKTQNRPLSLSKTQNRPLSFVGEVLLYITPPADTGVIDEYFALGASRIACSLEVWDMAGASEITPGKIGITGRGRHLKALEYIAQKYGPGKALSNLIIGIEGFETLAEGAQWLAERGIQPSASIWMPMGRPVRGSMKPPGVDYYKRAKELYAGLYMKYKLEPTETSGLHVCADRDFWNYACGGHSQ